MKKISLAFLLVFSAFVFLPRSVFAAVRCETQYGGGEVCVKTGELQVDKKVWSKMSNSFVDNLWQFSEIFKAGEEVVFKLKVKNVGDETFSSVNVWDSLPGNLVLTSGSLNYTINDLVPGETDEREIKAKFVKNDGGCPVNVLEARSGDRYDKDTAKLCVEGQVLGKGKGIPKTGPEMWVLGALPAIGGFGIYLKSKFKKIN